jgi:hypothetical protein
MKKSLKKRGGPRENSGRPKLENPRRRNLVVRVTDGEWEQIREIAAKNGGLSAWVRARLGL